MNFWYNPGKRFIHFSSTSLSLSVRFLLGNTAGFKNEIILEENLEMNRFSPSLLHLRGSLYKNHLLPVRVTRKGGIGRGQTGQSPTSTSGTTKICNPNHQRQLSTKPGDNSPCREITTFGVSIFFKVGHQILSFTFHNSF